MKVPPRDMADVGVTGFIGVFLVVVINKGRPRADDRRWGEATIVRIVSMMRQ
jgi:hypothetical protein